MMKKLRISGRMLAVTFFCIFAAACSGGGGGGGGESNGGSIIPSAYKGVQTQAVIDQNNAEEITLSGYSGGTLGSALVTASPLNQSSAAANPSSSIGAILAGAVQKMNLGSPAARPLAATPIDKDGPCGGEVAGSIDGAVVGSFTGHLDFAGYCEGGAHLNGNVELAGSQNPATGAVQVTFHFNGLSISAPEDAYQVDGSMVMNLHRNTPDSTTLGVNLVLTDRGTGKTEYMAYTVASTMTTGYSENVISGKYYSHDRGYVEFVTETPVRVPEGEELPEQGALRFTGARETWAKLTFEGFGLYRVDTSDGGFIQHSF